VISFGGTRVAGVKEFQKMVAGVSPGSDVTLEILRSGKRMRVPVELAELEGPVPRAVSRKAPLDAWGLSVMALPAEAARFLGVEGGVEVQDVDPSGPAGKGGIRDGDILLRINKDSVTGLDAYRRLQAKLPRGQMVSVLVGRDGGQMYLAFRNK
jgi:serine protease Do